MLIKGRNCGGTSGVCKLGAGEPTTVHKGLFKTGSCRH